MQKEAKKKKKKKGVKPLPNLERKISIVFLESIKSLEEAKRKDYLLLEDL